MASVGLYQRCASGAANFAGANRPFLRTHLLGLKPGSRALRARNSAQGLLRRVPLASLPPWSSGGPIPISPGQALWILRVSRLSLANAGIFHIFWKLHAYYVNLSGSSSGQFAEPFLGAPKSARGAPWGPLWYFLE